jgi:hypothetical protein
MIDGIAGTRRGVLTGGAKTLSAAGVIALLGLPGAALAAANPSQDVALLNAALALEHEGIAAYQLGAESKLLAPPVLAIAVTFQGHHKQHRDDLIAAVKRLGGAPVGPKALGDYAKELDAAALKDQAGVLKLALRLERGATNAYLGIIPSLAGTDLHTLAARTACDEAFHAAILGQALNEAIPQKAPMFG